VRSVARDPKEPGENSAIAVGSKIERGVARGSPESNAAGTHLAQCGPPCILQTVAVA
jgi:hypothetical protein